MFKSGFVCLESVFSSKEFPTRAVISIFHGNMVRLYMILEIGLERGRMSTFTTLPQTLAIFPHL